MLHLKFLILSAGLLCAACGVESAEAPLGADATSTIPQSFTLELLSPLTDASEASVSIGRSERRAIVVRYLDAAGRPVEQGTVWFKLTSTDPENNGAATLSSDRQDTEKTGQAEVWIQSGAAPGEYLLTVEADKAADLRVPLVIL